MTTYMDLADAYMAEGTSEQSDTITPNELNELNEESRGMHEVRPLPPMFEALPRQPIPTGPCAVCEGRLWRWWWDEETQRAQWICNGCAPLVVVNPDGSLWRA